MNAIRNFAFEEHLVRVVEKDGELWFVGKDVCEALAIKNHNDALANLDADEKGVAITDPLSQSERGGGAQTTVIISEPGVYRLVFRSRKEEAERFKRWLAHEVIPQIRRTGAYRADATEIMRPEPATNVPAPIDEMTRRKDLIQEFRMSHTKEETRRLWRQMGLPVADEQASPEDLACLAHLLDAAIHGATFREHINGMFGFGKRSSPFEFQRFVRTVGPGFSLPISHPMIGDVYAGTRWIRPFENWLRLPGAQLGSPQGGKNARDFVWVPSHYLG